MVTSQAACPSASKPLEILMRAVVTMVVSKAEMKRQNHKPAMIVCNLAGLMFGTVDGTLLGLVAGIADIAALRSMITDFKRTIVG